MVALVPRAEKENNGLAWSILGPINSIVPAPELTKWPPFP